MIQYFKYYFASACNRPSEEKIGYLEAVKTNVPEMTWLYANELGIEYAQNGDREKALECADKIYEHSETDVVSYYIRALVAKNIDKDYDAAIEYCNQGNKYSENYEFYRQIALNYLLKGDYKKAQENAQTAYDTNEDLTTINTLAFCAVANKDNDKFNEMKKLFDEYNEQLEEGCESQALLRFGQRLGGKRPLDDVLVEAPIVEVGHPQSADEHRNAGQVMVFGVILRQYQMHPVTCHVGEMMDALHHGAVGTDDLQRHHRGDKAA